MVSVFKQPEDLCMWKQEVVKNSIPGKVILTPRVSVSLAIHSIPPAFCLESTDFYSLLSFTVSLQLIAGQMAMVCGREPFMAELYHHSAANIT